MSYQNENNTIFCRDLKGKLVKIFIFNKIYFFLKKNKIKYIYNFFCIIKKFYIKFRNYSFSFKQTFSNSIFSTL